MDYFFVEGDRSSGYTGYIQGKHKWKLPGIRNCPGCNVTWGTDSRAYPSVDLTPVATLADFEEARAEPAEEYDRMCELVLPQAGAEERSVAPQAAASTEPMKEKTPRVDWAELLRRTFALDVFACARCGGTPRGCTVPCTGAARGLAGPVSGPSRPLRSSPPPQHGFYPAYTPARIVSTGASPRPARPMGTRTPCASSS